MKRIFSSGWHVALTALIGTATIAASHWFLSSGLLQHALLAIGAVAVVFLPVGLLLLVVSSPNGGKTIAERVGATPLPADSLEPLRLAWNSDADPAWPAAETLASMSQTAYLSPVVAEPCLRALGFDHIETVVQGSMLGYVASQGDVTVVAFRGTDDIPGWFVDLDELATPTPHGDIHRGFYDAYQSLKPQITAVLAQSRPKHLWLTGHSLGGALALVCAYDLIENQQRAVDGVITLGQPMVACRQLAAYLDRLLCGRYAYFVNEADIVPRVPPPPYAHCGSLVWFTEDGIRLSRQGKPVLAAAADAAAPAQAKLLPPVDREEFQRLKSGLRADLGKLDRLPKGSGTLWKDIPCFADHAVERYVDRVRGLFEKT